MKVHDPKLYNMAHLLALNVLLLPKDQTIIFNYPEEAHSFYSRPILNLKVSNPICLLSFEIIQSSNREPDCYKLCTCYKMCFLGSNKTH